MRQISLVKEIQDDAITFGNEANLARAIPYVRDGLKPSQRAVIFGALDQGYTSNKPHVKSLKLDGFCVGTLWPHGSEYSTIVRLTQDFVLNIPLLDMHGSNGSFFSPEAAASRYTEVRLSKACEDGLLKNLDKNTVNWIKNYSEDKLWPELLPALLPNLYCNGSDGIGFCYSQSWLPGNLNEFYNKVVDYTSGKKLTFDDLAPDFPTKGVIVNKKDLHTIYETGQGTVILRGRAEIKNDTIIITELPYQIYVSDYMEQLKNLIVPDKKGIVKITGISNIYNMSGADGMHIEIECEDDPNIVLNKLYKYSNLQISLTASQYGIVNGLPELFNLEKYIKVYVDHNINCIVREYKYDLDKATARKEIVDGLIKAISIIDKVIAVIKKSKSADAAKDELIKVFNFTEVQAKAIIDMRLGKLANLEIAELNKELNELIKSIEKCNKLLASDKLQKKEFINRLSDFTDKYGWTRRTEVTDIDLDAEKVIAKQNTTKIIDTYTICLTKNNTLRRILTANYKASKSTDIICAVNCSEDSRVILISTTGMMYKVDVKKIPVCSQSSSGTPVDTFVNDNILILMSGTETPEYILMTTENGLIKKIESKVVFELSKCVGAIIMKVEEYDKIIDCRLVNDTDSITLNNGKKDKVIQVKDLIAKGRGAGGIVGLKPYKTNKITII